MAIGIVRMACVPIPALLVMPTSVFMGVFLMMGMMFMPRLAMVMLNDPGLVPEVVARSKK